MMVGNAVIPAGGGLTTTTGFFSSGGAPTLLPKTQDAASAWDVNDGATLPGGQTVLYGAQADPGYVPHVPTMWVQVAGVWKDKYLGRYNVATGKNAFQPGYYGQLNDRLEIVGWFHEGDDRQSGQLWQNGKVRNLNRELLKQGWMVTFLNGLNNKGTLVGQAKKVSGPGAGKARKPVAIVRVEILDKDKKVVSKLRVGKMSKPGVLSGTVASPALDIEKDSDRFYIRIPDGKSFGATSIKAATVENPDGSYNDDPTEIDLQVEGNDLITKSMLLVSDDVDDAHPVDGIADNARNDRTHKVQLGGKLQIKSIHFAGADHDVDVRTPVPIDKTVSFAVIILRERPAASGGVPVRDPIAVEYDLTIAQERYAQVGIKLKWTITTADPPHGVDLDDGLDDEYYFDTPTPEEEALFGALGTPSTDDIHIFYVNVIDTIINQVRAGHTFSEGSLPPNRKVYAGNVVISSNREDPFTVSHELGHVLGEIHKSREIMVMKNGESIFNTLGARKRFYQSEEITMKSSKYAK